MNRPPPHGNQPLPPRLEGGELIWWSLLGVAIYLVSLRSPSAAWRRCRLLVRGPFAVTLPFVFAFLCAWAVGIDATAKYLAHTVAATAIATALLVARAARQLFAAAVANPARRQTALRAVQAAPFALALLLPIVSRPLHSGKPTVSELRQVRDLLHDRYGWTAEQVMSNLRAGYGIAALQGLRRIEIADPRPPRQPRDPYATAILLFVDRDDLPDPLPPNWEIIRSARRALVLITTRSRLDWSRFEVCLRLRNAPEQPCQESSLLFDPDAPGLEAPNMPWGGPHWDGILALRAPLRPGEPSDPTEAIFMPRMQLVCGGYVAGDSAGALHVDADRRQALLSPGPGDGNRVELQWDLGSRDCPIGYDGWLPFIVAGDADTVQRIAALLRKAEADGAR